MYSIMIASLLMLQKPRLPWTDFMAWWPGGRTSAKALSTCPSMTIRAALIAPPAEIMCDSVVTVSTSGKQKWSRITSSSVAMSGLYSTRPSMSKIPSSLSWSWV